MPRRKHRIQKKEIRQLLSKATACSMHEDEVCGLLIDNGYFLQIKETRNIANKKGSFLLDGREIRSLRKTAERLEMEVVGTFHSHILSPAEPGRGDITGAVDNSLMLIFDTVRREAKLWRIKHGRAYRVSFESI